MTRQPVKLVLLCFALMSTAFVTSGLASQAQGAPESPSADFLVGKWKLNVDKSTNPPASEAITITSQGSGFMLDFDEKMNNGYNPKYSITTDMKGTTVKPIYADGSKTNDQWRVTRQGPKKFEMELISQFGGWKDEYEVSNDGTTMTMHRQESQTGIIGGKIDSNGRFHRPEHIFVFDKMK
ncbi:MAG TPA: hypothetical protein VNZ03_13335 [Terriglobales bacterium]|nr:hypothetical protein [Terriglobales bacterium]